MYLVYNVEQGKITDTYTNVHWNDINAKAKEEYNKAINNQVCDNIYVFLDLNNEKMPAKILSRQPRTTTRMET